MQRSTIDRIERVVIPVLLGFALLGSSVWGATRSAQASAYRRITQDSYTRAFTELADAFEDMTVTLGKLLAVSTPRQTVLLLDDVWRLSGSVVSLMSQIPSAHLDSESMNRLVVQLGDYAHTLSGKTVQGMAVTEQDRAQLQSLYTACVGVTAELQRRLQEGDIPLAVLTNDQYYTQTLASAPQGADAAEQDPAQTGSAGVSDNAPEAQSAEGEDAYKQQEGITEFPTLIYDGPFSESTEKATPRGLSGQAVDEEQARAIAERTAGVPMQSAGYSNGRIKSYDFSGTDENGAALDISIAAQSGQVVWLMGASTSDISGVPPESESKRYRELAAQYLSGMGYQSMRPTYAQYYGGCALVSLVAVQDGALVYNDLIKVWIDRETLKVVGVDARNYLFSHVQRSLETPSITMQEAEALLSGELTVQERALALIPITPGAERLCYEFRCLRGEETYILYLNVTDGSEEQVFRIIDDEEGEAAL